MRQILPIAIFLAALAAPGWCAPSMGTDPGIIGIVRNTEGQAMVHRGGMEIRAAVGTKLAVGDTLSTGPDGSVGIILRDNSSLSLGPQSRIALQDFQFSPAEGRLSFIARLAKGTMAYMSGIIGKLSPRSVRIDTPVASIGIRGTCFVVNAGEGILD